MNNMKKRLPILILALCLLITAAPVGAAAADTLTADIPIYLSVEGATGIDVNVRLNPDYVSGAKVVSVGDDGYAFCSALRSITFLNPNTTIGSSCFSNCRSLTSVNLPSNRRILDYSTFWQCDKLTSITLPSTLTFIQNGCFQDCKYLYADSQEDTPL